MKLNNVTGYIATGLVGAGVTFGLCWYFMDYSRKDIIEAGKEFAVINEIQEKLEDVDYHFFENDNLTESKSNAINGWFKGKVDEFTTYNRDVSPVEEQTIYINTAGTSEASGFQVDISDDGNILITEIKSGLTADKQGLKVGDVITHIDDISVSEKGYENYANKILGKDGTKVKFTIRRDNEIFDMEFTRAHHYINEADFEQMKDVGYIKIRSFGEMMQGQLDQAVTKAESGDKIIFDLRDNQGGNGGTGAKLAAQLSGESFVDWYYNNGEVEHETFGCAEPRLKDKEVILLVNENTASAAEIFTSIIKQNLNVTIVGTNTYGKGIYQQEANLSDGGKLHYTAGYFTVGDWECWQDKGIAPDIEVEMDSALIGTDEDIQLQKALELLE